MAILRKNNKERFTTVPQNILCDKNLSLKEMGLLIKMLSLPDDWEFSENGLLAIFERDGQASVRSGLKALEENGYLKRVKSRGSDGKITGVDWYLTEVPNKFDEPYLENPLLDKPNLENPPQYNTKELNTKGFNTKDSIKKNNKKKVTQPTLEEIQEYIAQKNYEVDAQTFFDYYDSADWHDAKGNPVKCWKQRLATWNSRKEKNGSVRTGSSRQKSTFDRTYVLDDNTEECPW